ncbi:MAG: sugar phosphate nucleotidyltransferase [Terriglobia bacterium]
MTSRRSRRRRARLNSIISMNLDPKKAGIRHRRAPGSDPHLTVRASAFDHAYAVIMAGGSGTRFWPVSRRKHPKQLLRLFGETTLLEQTVARIEKVIPPERTYVFTSELVRDAIIRLLPRVPKEQIVGEPAARNTAPTIGLAAHEILARDPDGLMVVLPSDHVVRKPADFRRALRAACRWASAEGRSVILGIKPTRPDTGFGYVRFGPQAGTVDGEAIHHVKKFTEKPPARLARRYLASGEYAWNSGMFIWQASTLLANLERFQPRMAKLLAQIARAGGVRARTAFRRLFPRLEKISVDYALMQQIPEVYGIAADIGWSDVGSWAVAYDLQPKDKDANVQPRDAVAVNSRGNIVVSPRKTVVTVDVRDLVIVETDDVLLVSSREHSQDVGKAVERLEEQGRRELL